MIKEIIKQWDDNKHELENYFKTTKQSEYNDYAIIVKKLLELVIIDNWDVSKMTIIDDGEYQGTRIFIIPRSTYQPSAEDYIVTDTYYGSCSGCDTLQGISFYDDDLPTDIQVEEYMTLALHLVQKLHYLSSNEE